MGPCWVSWDSWGTLTFLATTSSSDEVIGLAKMAAVTGAAGLGPGTPGSAGKSSFDMVNSLPSITGCFTIPTARFIIYVGYQITHTTAQKFRNKAVLTIIGTSSQCWIGCHVVLSAP